MKSFFYLFIWINAICFCNYSYGYEYVNQSIEWDIRGIRKYFNYPDASFCYCYSESDEIFSIRNLINNYEYTAERYFLNDVRYPKEKWEREYYNKMNELKAKAGKRSPRYRDVYHHALIFGKVIDLATEFKCQSSYESYMSPGWCYTIEEKKEKIAKECARIQQERVICKNKLHENIAKIANEYQNLYASCSKNHFSKVAYHDHALLAYLHNNFDKSIELLTKIAEEAEKNNETALLESEHYQNLGAVCLEVMAYDKAIEYLSEAIKKDPENKQAYFERAVAYFETGSFDLSINDYQAFEPQNISYVKIPEGFGEALLSGLKKGSAESLTEYVPSLCNSAYGIGRTLWTAVQDPITTTKEFTNACYEVAECVVEYCQNIEWETVDEYGNKLKDLYANFESLSDEDKGNLIGHTIGKYGVDFFAGGIILKGISSYNKLKAANRMCNLEAMSLSCANKEAILASSLKHAEERQSFFKNVKIHADRQNKHIVGMHNYEIDRYRSILTHKEPEKLLRAFAGKGTSKSKSIEFCSPGYVEQVDFEQIIGYYIHESNPTVKMLTTKGTIKYSKDGAHIVPSHPNG